MIACGRPAPGFSARTTLSPGSSTMEQRPLMLFDGVCNLCNAAVQWVIERDARGQIRFASLQSEAGRQALREALGDGAGRLPDSFVLIDAHGVHSESSAALAVAGHLGWPYRLLTGTRIVPRFVRDAVYRLVARNRYRWFGRRDTCMLPTPHLASRFLDAAEPRPAIPPSAAPEVPARPSWLAAWLPRFAIAYVLVYMAPFPLTLLGYLFQLPLVADIPGLASAMGWLLGLHGTLINPLVTWVGQSVFGVEALPVMTGSGDQTFNYIDLVVDLVLAVVISLGWTQVVAARRVSARTADVANTLARYYLGTTMLVYGWVKVFPLQFPVPGADRLMQPYGDSSPMGLAWTFLGASVGYQIFAGLCEILGGYLLFWRRTALLGALVSFAVMSNVMAINFFFDVPVKLFSSHLVLVALFIAAPDLPRLVAALGFNLPVAPRRVVPFWQRPGRSAGAVMAVHLLLIAGLTSVHVSNNLAASRERGVLAEPSPLAGIYRVEFFARDGVEGGENPDGVRWVRVGLAPPYTATIQRASGDAVRMRIALDDEATTLSFFDRGAQPPDAPMFTYVEEADGVLRLTGQFDGKPTTVVMRKDGEGALLIERGFRWINEYPFNR
jgi:predicted DCC family thiol-disulfide oxidoreductase YuxK